MITKEIRVSDGKVTNYSQLGMSISRQDLLTLFEIDMQVVFQTLLSKFGKVINEMEISHSELMTASGRALGISLVTELFSKYDSDTLSSPELQLMSNALASLSQGFDAALTEMNDPDLRASLAHDNQRVIDQSMNDTYPEGITDDMKKHWMSSELREANKYLINRLWQQGMEHDRLDALNLVASTLRQASKLGSGAHYPILD